MFFLSVIYFVRLTFWQFMRTSMADACILIKTNNL